MSRTRLILVAVGSAVVLIAAALWVLGYERGGYTMTVNADISAGVSQSTSCQIVEQRAADGSSEPVLSIRPVGVIWMFHSERLGFARVRCGPFAKLEYTFEVLKPARLEIACNDQVELGEVARFYAIGYDADGRRISSDVKIEKWTVTGPLEQKAGPSSCEFPPWCGTVGPASFNANTTGLGTATVVATIGDYARGEKTITIVSPRDK